MNQNTIEIISATFAAGESRLFALSGTYFEVIEAVASIDVLLSDSNGAQNARMTQAGSSFFSKGSPFGVVQITSATAQTIRFAYGSGETGTRRSTGVVSIDNFQGAYSQAQATVTNASAALLAANAARRYLLIQNNDASGDIYVALDGTTATTVKGIKIAAGGSYECQGFCPAGAIAAIGSLASNANIVIVEG